MADIKVNPDFSLTIEQNSPLVVETLAAHICSFTGYTRGKLLERLGDFICMHCGDDTSRSRCYCMRND